MEMFTGIIKSLGTISNIKTIDSGRRFIISTDDSNITGDLRNGDSIAVDGVCLTVTDLDGNTFGVDLSEETLDKTTMSEKTEGERVNLEPSLSVGDPMGGHFVFGHVDTTVRVDSLEKKGEFYRLSVEVPRDFRQFLARKGSVALDGISLTINSVDNDKMSIRIIPHTYEKTRIRELDSGSRMNLEVDMVARYVYNISRYSDD